MRARSPLLTLAYVLAGILVICGLLLTFARTAGRTEPSIGSYGPSGLRLLAELLREKGYQLEVTRDPTPRLDPKRDVAISIEVREVNPLQSFGEMRRQPLAEQLEAFADKGGRFLQSQINADFQQVTRAAASRVLKSPYGAGQLTVHTEFAGNFPPAWALEEPRGTHLFLTETGAWSSVSPLGSGLACYVADFGGATNRFIDQADNAAAYLATIASIAPKGSRLVFLEAAWGNASDPGLFESIGDWAAAGWSQLLVLCLVVAYSLGKPFGIPEARRAKQMGQRELVDAYAGVLRRAGATHVALQAVANDADRRLRRALKMDAGLERAERDKRLPNELNQLLVRVDMAIESMAPPDIAMGLADQLDRLVSDFCGDRRTLVRKRRKS